MASELRHVNKELVQPYKNINKKIYAYTLPEVPNHDGYIKVGETIQDTEERIKSQVSTAGLNPETQFIRLARRADGEWFSDHDLHRYYEMNGITRGKFNDSAREWFYFNDTPERAEQLTDQYIGLDYSELQVSAEKADYVLRDEQQAAVDATLNYINTTEHYKKEFLWNAKPRFGKTLTAYDLMLELDAMSTLIVTNRPAVANSWYDDFKKFIAHKDTDRKFVAGTPELRQTGTLSHEEFRSSMLANQIEEPKIVAFVSLQDLKGARFAGGEYEKLRWLKEYNWDLLIIDEAHEGVDTKKTDRALNAISTKMTLHLSGTPFKQLQNNKFSDEQIFNWTYLDEQEVKANWDYSVGSNPYETLPRLNLFTYQMSNLVVDDIREGKTIGENNYDYTFDLNEFFKVDDNNNKFIHEDDVIKFLDNLASGRFPFAETEYRQELQHTMWLFSRVNTVKAMEKLLRKHPVFKHYEIVIAAGDGKSYQDDDETFEQEAGDVAATAKSFEKVTTAIANNPRTITLSCGQLTTGVTIPEWTGILMLSNIKSPALYFQAAFRAQNAHEYVDENTKLQRKENAYVFDFSPEGTLELYEQFANNLSGKADAKHEEKEDNIRQLLNFFPVLAEDSTGSMREIDASEVLTIPVRNKAKEVVKQGFMSNLLFINISGIFSAPEAVKDILGKIPPEKNKKHDKPREVNDTKPSVDEDGNIDIPQEDIEATTDTIFGPAIYADQFPKEIVETQSIVDEIMKVVSPGFENYYEQTYVTRAKSREVQKELEARVTDFVTRTREETIAEQENLSKSFENETADIENNPAENNTNQKELELLVSDSTDKFYGAIADYTNQELENIVHASLENEEEKKKRTTEDDVRDHLRGFTRTIPIALMAYGDKNTTVDNFEDNISEESFEELTSITKAEFQKLRDGFDYLDDETGEEKRFKGLFNKPVFNASILEFSDKKKELSNYFDKSQDEDIFDYIPPQETNQIFTPHNVVVQMVDVLEKENPGIFANKETTFIDLYSKSGLYITEIITRLFDGLSNQIPDEHERLKHIIENQVYAVCPSNIIYNVVRTFVMADFEGISDKNIVEYDLTEDATNGTASDALKKIYGDNMKFDVVIGNPPYQEENKNRNRDDAIYHYFLEEAYELSDKVIMITPARFLFNVGSTPTKWNEKMLADPHLKVVYYEVQANKVFPNTDIKGGVAITYRNASSHYGEIGVFIPYAELSSVYTKVESAGAYNNGTISEIMYVQNKFDTDALFADYPELKNKLGGNGKERRLTSSIFTLVPELFAKQKTSVNNVGIYGREKNTRVIKYINGSYLEKHENLDKWKIFVPAANGSGAIGEVISTPVIGQPVIGQPVIGHTQTFISLGAYDNEFEAASLLKFIKSKFARAMLGIKKVTQNNKTKVTWSTVPLQDFTENSDIDWTKSIKEIDQQLYVKYDLNDEEISFIETNVQEMQ